MTARRLARRTARTLVAVVSAAVLVGAGSVWATDGAAVEVAR